MFSHFLTIPNISFSWDGAWGNRHYLLWKVHGLDLNFDFKWIKKYSVLHLINEKWQVHKRKWQYRWNTGRYLNLCWWKYTLLLTDNFIKLTINIYRSKLLAIICFLYQSWAHILIRGRGWGDILYPDLCGSTRKTVIVGIFLHHPQNLA